MVEPLRNLKVARVKRTIRVRLGLDRNGKRENSIHMKVLWTKGSKMRNILPENASRDPEERRGKFTKKGSNQRSGSKSEGKKIGVSKLYLVNI